MCILFSLDVIKKISSLSESPTPKKKLKSQGL
jgi:hypothetical protein